MSKAHAAKSHRSHHAKARAHAEALVRSHTAQTQTAKSAQAPAAPAVQPATVTDRFAPLAEAGTFAPKTAVEWKEVHEQPGPHHNLTRAEVEKMSLSELAAFDLPRLLDLATGELQRVGPSTTPDDPAIRPVRIAIKRLSDNIDMFSSVYPPHEWKALRARVDAIYEALGNLKDVTNSGLQGQTGLGWDTMPSATDQALVKLHNELLPQRQSALGDAKAALLADEPKFREMLAHPYDEPKHVKQHHHDDSRFFFGGIDFKPKAGMSGVENLRRLAAGQVEVALDTSKSVMKLDTPIGPKHEKEFHDFRKRVRTLIHIASFFPEVFKDPTAGVELERKLYSLTFEYGEIEDRLVKARTATTLGSTEGRAAAEAEVKELWPMLVQWQKDQKINGVLKEFAGQLGEGK